MFQVTTYGNVLESWEANGTTTLTLDCGSHCEEYGQPEEDWAGENFTAPGVCGWAIGDIQQPVGGPRKRNETCPPVAGPAVITSLGWVPWILIYAPVCLSLPRSIFRSTASDPLGDRRTTTSR
jgi:hypothetical protein